MLSPQTLDHIAAHYRLHGARVVRHVENSRANLVVHVSSRQGEFLLRRPHDQPLLTEARPAAHERAARLRAQHALMHYIAARGVPVAAPVPTRSGSTVLQIDGVSFTLHPFVHGEPFVWGQRDHVAAAATTLAWFHRVVADYDDLRSDDQPPLLQQAITTITHGGASLAQFFALEPAVQSEVAPAVEQIAAALPSAFRTLRAVPNLAMVRLPIHGDYRQGNLLFQGDTLAAVLDWDNSCVDARVWDVAIAVGNLSRAAHRAIELDLRLVRCFMRSYSTLQQLTAGEHALLPQIIITNALLAVLQRWERLAAGQLADRPKHLRKFHKYVNRWIWLMNNTPALEHALATTARRSWSTQR